MDVVLHEPDGKHGTGHPTRARARVEGPSATLVHNPDARRRGRVLRPGAPDGADAALPDQVQSGGNGLSSHTDERRRQAARRFGPLLDDAAGMAEAPPERDVVHVRQWDSKEDARTPCCSRRRIIISEIPSSIFSLPFLTLLSARLKPVLTKAMRCSVSFFSYGPSFYSSCRFSSRILGDRRARRT